MIEHKVTYSKDIVSLSMDYTSALPLAFFFVNVMEGVHEGNYVEMTLLITTMIVADLLTVFIKRMSTYTPSFLNFLISRPKGASNTDILSRNGIKPPNSPGFPSGHMTMTSVFAVYRLIRLYRRNYNPEVDLIINITNLFKTQLIPIAFYLGIIVLMAAARLYKKCHTITQVIGGTLLGTIFAIILDKIVVDFL